MKTTTFRIVPVWLALAMLTPHARVNAADAPPRHVVLRAHKAFEEGQGAHGIKLNESLVMVLYDHVLIEDDGPGIGSDADWLRTDRAPTLDIVGDTRVKKILHIDRPAALAAHLVVPAGVAIELNGHVLDTTGAIEDTESSFAEILEISPSLLKEGDNEIILSNAGSKARTVKIALTEDILRNAPERRDWPRRSFKSLDAGKTWAPIEGEFMVRLHLTQYVPQGDVISPVIELGGELQKHAPLLAPISIKSVAVTTETVQPPGTRVEFLVRSGTSPVYDTTLWSDWRPTNAPYPAASRYLQWKATLFTSDPVKTPLMRSVTIDARSDKSPSPAWTGQLLPGAFHNEEIRYTSMPFEYENPMHPKMVDLRRKYKLDQIVAGASTETEQMVKLRDWIAHQWKICAPEEHFPAWDADEILTRKYGFCVQYAVTLMQCAISMGHQARFLFGHNPGAFDGGGHEVCEIWSDQYRKWIFYDVNQDWFYLNAKTLEPLSMLEVHDIIEKTYYKNHAASLEHPPQQRIRSDDIAVAYGTNLWPSVPPTEFARHFVDGHYTSPTRWLIFNYLPRNNFYESPYPQPKTQGAAWNYSDYWCWEDAATPKRWQYRNFTGRRSDLNWTINQVRFDATVTDQSGVIAMQMGTVTPYFDTYLVNLDGKGWRESPRNFAWNLHPGHNRVEMRVRNTSGVEGAPSFLEVDMKPASLGLQ